MDKLALALLLLTLVGYVAGAVAGLLCLRAERVANIGAFGLAALAALNGVVASLIALLAGAGQAHQSVQILPAFLPYVRFSIRLDPLSLFFTLLVSLIGLAISIYSLGYARGFYGRKNVGSFGAFFNVSLLATTLVFLADNAFFFLIVWEIMALSTFFLVSFEHEKEESRNAGVLYFVMSHIGTGCLMLGFLLLFQASGGIGFEGFHAIGAKMAAGPRDAAFVLFLVGFGVKAGFIPLHIWLPAAHPAAPSNVSAMMSGVLIKTGIYGLTRVAFDFMGRPRTGGASPS